MKTLRSGKLLPLFAAISAAFIIAGIVLFALFGFNTASDKPEKQTVTVEYNVLFEIEGKTDDLQAACETAFTAQGLNGWESETMPVLSDESLVETSDYLLVYTFTKADAAALNAARDAINANTSFGDAVFHAEVRTLTQKTVDTTSAWRGAIALALGAIVAMFYVGVRFGIACGVGGFVCCVNNALLTAAIFAACRIPVYAAAPLLYAAFSAASGVILWTIACIKLRENRKTPAYASMTGSDAIKESAFASWKPVCFTALALFLAVLVLGGVATNSLRLFVLPMVVSVAVAAYSVFLIGPFAAAPVQKSLDARKAKKTGGYKGKKKAVEPQA